jgi:hypothetical protein
LAGYSAKGMPLRRVIVLHGLQPVPVTLMMTCQVAEHVALGIVLVLVDPDAPKPRPELL